MNKSIRTKYDCIGKSMLKDYFVSNPKERKNAVKKDGMLLEYIVNQEYYICIRAVRQNEHALMFVNPMIENYIEICLIAVKKNPSIVRLVDKDNMSLDDYTEVCIQAVKRDGMALEFINSHDLPPENYTKICIEAIKHNSSALQYVTIQTHELCILAICRPHQTHAFKGWPGKNYDVLKYVKNQTPEICKAAIEACGQGVIQFIRDKSLIESIIEVVNRDTNE
jgi:hypothetical protein